MATRRDFKVMQTLILVLPNGDENEINVITFASEFDVLILKILNLWLFSLLNAQWKNTDI